MPASTFPNPSARPYLSNPFELLWEGLISLQSNALTLLIILGCQVGLLLAFIPALIALLVALSAHSVPGYFVAGAFLVAALAATLVVSVRLYAATVLTYLACARGEGVEFKATYIAGKPHAWRLFWASLSVAALTILGLLLFIVPGVLFLYWYSMTPYIVVEQKLGASESRRASKALVKGHGLETYGLFGAVQILNLAAAFPLVGSIVSLVSGFAQGTSGAVRYLQLSRISAGEETAPPASSLNYLAVFVGPVILILIIGFAILLVAFGQTGPTTP